MKWFYECLNGATLRDSRPVDWLPHIDSLLVYTYYIRVCIPYRAGAKSRSKVK